MPCLGRHRFEMTARTRQGGDKARSKIGAEQLAAQSPQKVQPPRLKSTLGVPSSSGTRICSGQAAMQSPQWVQCSASDIALDHGGRIAAGPGLGRDRIRRNARRP